MSKLIKNSLWYDTKINDYFYVLLLLSDTDTVLGVYTKHGDTIPKNVNELGEFIGVFDTYTDVENYINNVAKTEE